jgi:nucleotide-binding universal stress UspA family protein
VDLRLIDGELRMVGADLLQQCQRRVEQITEHAVTVTTEIVHGAVVPSLVDLSESASLVVLQHHRMGRERRVPSMSVTNGVAARAHCPVVAVPDSWDGASRQQGAIAVGVEDAATSSAVLAAALEQAQRLAAPVEVVRAWFYSAAFDGQVFEGQAGVEETARVHENVRKDFEELISRFPDVDTHIAVVHGRPADVLVAGSEHARLLVVGRHQPRLPIGAHLGPVTRSVLAHSSCPVMVVDPREPAV